MTFLFYIIFYLGIRGREDGRKEDLIDIRKEDKKDGRMEGWKDEAIKGGSNGRMKQ